MNKLFIIGLPRTGTTSICAALLDHDLKVAHTALTKQAFELADVVADTPCFCDYQQLDQMFPDSKFVYLQRNLAHWIPSIQMLLTKIMNHIQQGQHLHPLIQRCFDACFGILSAANPLDATHLAQCYATHQQHIKNHFTQRNQLLSIDISDKNSWHQLLKFLGKPEDHKRFPHINSSRMITAWKDIKHPNKVNSNAIGPERRKFFDYASQPPLLRGD